MSERDDIAPLLDDLARTLDTLREAVAGGSRGATASQPIREMPRSSPPRPPTPRELFQFTEEYTIPTLIALLEATVRSLELLRAVMRVAGGRGLPGVDRSPGVRPRETGRRALDTLDTVLADLQDAIEGQPTDPRARELLTEARDLRTDIDDMLAVRDTGRDSGARSSTRDRAGSAADEERDPVTIAVEDEGTPRSGAASGRQSTGRDDRDSGSSRSVDAGQPSIEEELDSIKRQLERADDEAPDGAGSEEPAHRE